ncbi:MAG: hypothetical protein AMJ68_04460 [Acidithiobacillales bacterium SG8_45]|jgi:hypothetical protein|nr:MAG: hypothetical protein AMJ68_04460 [Acidithiobacillales bacterium SG8_45]
MKNKSRDQAEQPGFIRKQFEFAAHIRDPESNPAPDGIEDRRMAVYRELFFNNVEDFMASSYPVLHEILGEDRWQAMLRDYFAHHRAETPLFPEMPAEFLAYLQNTRQSDSHDPPFMLELAHYEWMELAAAHDDNEIDWSVIEPNGDLLRGHPAVSPLVWVLNYRFPVHRISLDYQPAEAPAEPTSIIVYRDREDQVGFIEINPMTTILLQRLQQEAMLTGGEALLAIAEEMQHPNPEAVVNGGLAILEDLRRHDIVLGTTK